MRSSLVATIVFLGLIGLGVRARSLAENRSPGSAPSRSTATKATFTVIGGWRSTTADARTDALLRARDRLCELVQPQYPDVNLDELALDEIDKKWVRNAREEKLSDVLKAGAPVADAPPDPTDDMRRVIMQVESPPELLTIAAAQDRDQRVQHRLVGLGRVVGIIVMMLATLAVYIRFDEWSRGHATGWLRLSAAGLVVSGAVAMWMFTS